METIRISFYLKEDLKKQLEEEAKCKGLSLNAYIRLIISERSK